MNDLRIKNSLIKIRKMHNLTQVQFAEKIGVSDKTVSKWECGNSIPDIIMLNQISKIFNVPINDIIVGNINNSYPKKIFSKKKIFIISILVLILICLILISFMLSGCTKQLKDSDGKVVQNELTGQTLTKNILCKPTNEDVINLYEKYNVDLNKLPSCETMSVTDGGYEGLWTSIFVKPLAWLIIQIGNLVNNYGLAVIIATLLIRLVVMPITKKTAVQSENMKLAKKDLDRLEKKYANRTSQEDQMQKAQEMMIIYKKFNINPMSGCLLAFIQLPLFFAFLEAINRVPAIFENKFLGLQMGTSAWIGISNGNYLYIILIVLIIGTTYFSFKNTMNDQSGPAAKQMKTTLYIMLGFIAFASFTLSAAIGVYWITSSVFTIVQNQLVKRRKERNSNVI